MEPGNEKVTRVIQHKRTGMYLMESGEWTSNFDDAHHLPNVLSAVRLSRTLGLQDAELVLKFEDGRYDLRLDL